MASEPRVGREQREGLGWGWGYRGTRERSPGWTRVNPQPQQDGRSEELYGGRARSEGGPVGASQTPRGFDPWKSHFSFPLRNAFPRNHGGRHNRNRGSASGRHRADAGTQSPEGLLPGPKALFFLPSSPAWSGSPGTIHGPSQPLGKRRFESERSRRALSGGEWPAGAPVWRPPSWT